MPRPLNLLVPITLVALSLLAIPALAQKAPVKQQPVRTAPARPKLRTAQGVLRHQPARPGRKSVAAYHGHEWFLETAAGERLALLPTASATAKTLRASVDREIVVTLQWYPGKPPHPAAQAPLDPMTRKVQNQGAGWHVQSLRALPAKQPAPSNKKMTTRHVTGTLRHVPVDSTRKSVAAYHGISWFLETTVGERLSLIPTATATADALRPHIDGTVTLDLQWYPGKAPHPMEQAPVNPMTRAPELRGAGWQITALAP